MYWERRPLLIGFQVLPPSSVRNAPAAEMAIHIRRGLPGSRMMVCRHMPPAPGCHCGLVPCLATVVRALDDLADPPARLRHIDSSRLGGRTLHVINLPAGKVRAADLPFLTCSVRSKNERAFARTHENTNLAHDRSFRLITCSFSRTIRYPSFLIFPQ